VALATTGVLTRQQIIERIERDNLVKNVDRDGSISPASYELRVGCFWDWDAETEISLSDKERITVAPGGFVLMGTIEEVNLPLDLIGMMYLRSTPARLGFGSWFQGIVDPGYRGTLNVALHNHSRRPRSVAGGQRICHIVFEQLPQAAAKPYQGQYQGSRGVRPAKESEELETLKLVRTVF
jgi:dCTP deaminase